MTDHRQFQYYLHRFINAVHTLRNKFVNETWWEHNKKLSINKIINHNTTTNVDATNIDNDKIYKIISIIIIVMFVFKYIPQ